MFWLTKHEKIKGPTSLKIHSNHNTRQPNPNEEGVKMKKKKVVFALKATKLMKQQAVTEKSEA